MEKDKLIKMLIGFLPLLLLFLDPPEGMDPKAWGLFPFYAGAILMVMLRLSVKPPRSLFSWAFMPS